MRNLNKASKGVLILAVIAGLLLIFSAVGSTRAVLTYYNEQYRGTMELQTVGVQILENGAAADTLLTSLEEVKPGEEYPEAISAANTGSIDEFIRIKITRYWEKDGEKNVSLSPELIGLSMEESGWIPDPSNISEAETAIYYYPSAVAPGASTPALTGKLKLDERIMKVIKETTNGATVTTEFIYDGMTFHVDAVADAVQTHNATAAIKSAWGIDPEVLGIAVTE